MFKKSRVSANVRNQGNLIGACGFVANISQFIAICLDSVLYSYFGYDGTLFKPNRRHLRGCLDNFVKYETEYHLFKSTLTRICKYLVLYDSR